MKPPWPYWLAWQAPALQPPANNWYNVDTPGRAALARPDYFLPYGPGPSGSRADGCCHDCHPQGCFLKTLVVWATYCPKERVCGSSSFCCNRCTYKGVVPLYYFFLNPKCLEGIPVLWKWREGGGLSRAIRTTNPYVPVHWLYPKTPDRLMVQMNSGMRSIVNCPGNFTLQVIYNPALNPRAPQ